jgi:hypothetical protein
MESVRWSPSYSEALASASSLGRPLMIDFWDPG